MRLNRFIAHAGHLSRRQADIAIRQHRVTVNHQPAVLGQAVTPGVDTIILDGIKLVYPSSTIYYLINKPIGVVSSSRSEHGRPAVTDLAPDLPARVYPVGRLDLDSQGLMLLTNDGLLAHRIIHPRFKVSKEYHVRLDRPPSTSTLNQLRSGVKLSHVTTLPAQVKVLKHQQGTVWLSIILHQGMNRQIRRMAGTLGHQVLDLIRVSIGPLTLAMLKDKPYQQLTPKQINPLKQQVGL